MDGALTARMAVPLNLTDAPADSDQSPGSKMLQHWDGVF
jgi:hypothetical protein